MLTGFIALSGDELGRVNLLYLLSLFVFLPVLSLVLTMILLLRKNISPTTSIVKPLLALPLMPVTVRRQWLDIDTYQDLKQKRHWLFYQSQVFSLSFSFGCLVIFFVLLLLSDVSFVWRSTLLNANHLAPLLCTLSLPWSFWGEAQASLELLQRTQDFRLGQTNTADSVGLWWKYVFATQVVYSILPRGLMLMYARHQFLQAKSIAASQNDIVVDQTITIDEQSVDANLATVTQSVDQPYVLLNWAQLPAACQQTVQHAIGNHDHELSIDRTSLTLQTTDRKATGYALLVIVKSWEPPLGELHDLLKEMHHYQALYLLPVDWHGDTVKAVTDTHLQEWRRFAATLNHCKVVAV